MGFAVPLARWLKHDLKDWAQSLLSEKRIKQDGFFEPELVRQLWDEHQSNRANWQHALWAILMFQAWNTD